MLTKMTTTALMAVLLSGAGACTANSADTSSQKTAVVSNYTKPGAAVTYTHNLKSGLKAGEMTNFNLNLNEYYGEGLLIVNLSTEGDLTLYPSSMQKRFEMDDEISHDMDVSFTPNSNGRYYINVQAVATSPSGQTQPRIFSIPVQVGPEVALKPNPLMKTLPNGEKIIEMQAQEEIK